jgi:hypothetical protein
MLQTSNRCSKGVIETPREVRVFVAMTTRNVDPVEEAERYLPWFRFVVLCEGKIGLRSLHCIEVNVDEFRRTKSQKEVNV